MAQYININPYQQAIEAIVSTGHSVLQVFPFNDSTAYYFAVHQFTASQRTPTDDIQYNQVMGVNITRFIEQNSFINQNEFLRKFEAYLAADETQIIRMEFPNTMRWFKFASVVK